MSFAVDASVMMDVDENNTVRIDQLSNSQLPATTPEYDRNLLFKL